MIVGSTHLWEKKIIVPSNLKTRHLVFAEFILHIKRHMQNLTGFYSKLDQTIIYRYPALTIISDISSRYIYYLRLKQYVTIFMLMRNL
jgi:hypothetical protein